MLLLEVDDAMKKKPGPRSDSFLTGMNLDNGIQKTRDLNSGIFSTDIRISENISEYFLISNWTELDVWQYIFSEKIKLPGSLLYSQKKNIQPKWSISCLGSLYAT